MSDRKILYNRWHSMKSRCYRKKNPNYKNYGGRGIRICKAWYRDFEKFYTWAIRNGFKVELTIDRIDNNKSYKPTNCRWVTQSENNRNRNPTSFILHKGKFISLKLAAKISGLTVERIQDRRDKGWKDKNLLKPIKKETTLLYKNERKTQTEWAKKFNLKLPCLIDRLKRGWSIEKSLTTKPRKPGPIKIAKKYFYKRENLTLKEWAKKFNIAYSTIVGKINKGITIKQMQKDYL